MTAAKQVTEARMPARVRTKAERKKGTEARTKMKTEKGTRAVEACGRVR